MKIPMSSINVKASPQPRGKTHREKSDEYAERLAAGDVFPPIVVFNTPEHGRVIADGLHTYGGHEKNGSTEIEAEEHDGSYDEACDFALQSNLEHGFQRSAEDKRGYAVSCLGRHPEWTNNRIAAWIKVSPHLVGDVREQLENQSKFKSPDKRVSKNNKTFSAPKQRNAPPEDDDAPEQERPRVTASTPQFDAYTSAPVKPKVNEMLKGMKEKPASAPVAATGDEAWDRVAGLLDPQLHKVMKKQMGDVKLLAREDDDTIKKAGIMVFGEKWKLKRTLHWLKKEITEESRVGELVNKCISCGGKFEFTTDSNHHIVVTKPDGYDR